MPVVSSNYNPSFLFKNGHFSTIHSGLIRRVKDLEQERERLELSDGDFLDLDWSYSKSKTSKLIIILHGLEGTAQRPYITATAKLFNSNAYDACSVNFRGCSGEDNRLWRSYHSGETEDLNTVVEHCINKGYSQIYIKGFSLGGNVALKYLGEGRDLPTELSGAVAVSVPCDLHGSCIELHKLNNKLYHDRFRAHLLNRLKTKQKQFPDKITLKEIRGIKTLKQFDDAYTSKAHGFKDALDYYSKCNSLQFLSEIKIPTLLINAKNDSFLSKTSFPVTEAEKSSYLYLEMPSHGGHVGFYDSQNLYYNEKRSLEFLDKL